jgi:hypothetical protein
MRIFSIMNKFPKYKTIFKFSLLPKSLVTAVMWRLFHTEILISTVNFARFYFYVPTFKFLLFKFPHFHFYASAFQVSAFSFQFSRFCFSSFCISIPTFKFPLFKFPHFHFNFHASAFQFQFSSFQFSSFYISISTFTLLLFSSNFQVSTLKIQFPNSWFRIFCGKKCLF